LASEVWCGSGDNPGEARVSITHPKTDLSTADAVFVTNSSSESLERLLTGRGKAWEHNISPDAELEVLRLRHKFQDAFKT